MKDDCQRPIRAFAAALAAALAAAGCDSSTSSGAALSQSQLFDRIEIIGHRGTALGQFNKPRSLTVDPHDHLYVADFTGRVQKFAPNGRFLLSWQMPQTDLGKPKGMTIDAHGRVVVLEPHYARVNHYDTNGALVSQWGRYGTNRGQFTVPRAVALQTNGDLLVCEYSLVDRVQCFDPSSHAVRFAFGQAGREPGRFNRPEGLDVDSRGRIYIADSCNHRIQVFAADGRWLLSYGRPGTGPGEMSYPFDVKVDAGGRQYVCEFGNSRIQVFDADQQVVEVIGRLGVAPGEFNNPWSLALDSAGNLYVADGANHRVQKLIRKTGGGS